MDLKIEIEMYGTNGGRKINRYRHREPLCCRFCLLLANSQHSHSKTKKEKKCNKYFFKMLKFRRAFLFVVLQGLTESCGVVCREEEVLCCMELCVAMMDALTECYSI